MKSILSKVFTAFSSIVALNTRREWWSVSHGGNLREELRQGALVIGSPFSARMLAILKAGSLREMEQSVILLLFFALVHSARMLPLVDLQRYGE